MRHQKAEEKVDFLKFISNYYLQYQMKKKASGLQQQITLTHIIISQPARMGKRNIWTEKEDARLKQIIQDYGEDDWAFIAEQFNKSPKVAKRNPIQCRQRWSKNLSSKVKKQKWTKEDKAKLFNIFLSSKNNWVDISKYFKKRTDRDIKNTLYNSLRKGIRRLCKIANIQNGTNRVKHIKSIPLLKAISSLNEQIRSQELEIDFQSLIFEVSVGSIKQQESKVMDGHMIEILKEKLQKLLNNPQYSSCGSSYNEQEDMNPMEALETGKGPSVQEMCGQVNSDPVIHEDTARDSSDQEEMLDYEQNENYHKTYGNQENEEPVRNQSISIFLNLNPK